MSVLDHFFFKLGGKQGKCFIFFCFLINVSEIDNDIHIIFDISQLVGGSRAGGGFGWSVGSVELFL